MSLSVLIDLRFPSFREIHPFTPLPLAVLAKVSLWDSLLGSLTAPALAHGVGNLFLACWAAPIWAEGALFGFLKLLNERYRLLEFLLVDNAKTRVELGDGHLGDSGARMHIAHMHLDPGVLKEAFEEADACMIVVTVDLDHARVWFLGRYSRSGPELLGRHGCAVIIEATLL